MISQLTAKIFPAQERGVYETPVMLSRPMFHFGMYRREHKEACGALYVLNDDMLGGQASLRMVTEEKSCVILLPVTGAVKYSQGEEEPVWLAAGQAGIFFREPGDVYQVSNPFRNDTVSFLQIWFRTAVTSAGRVIDFDVNEHLNHLAGEASAPGPFHVALGKFDARGETAYNPVTAGNSVFVLVIEGAFEVAGRLLHPRDGLWIQDAPALDMEALSPGALLLLLEYPGA